MLEWAIYRGVVDGIGGVIRSIIISCVTIDGGIDYCTIVGNITSTISGIENDG